VVTWQVNGVAGGNTTVGTVTAGGVYTAPSAVPSPETVTVTALSAADPTKSASAQVTVTPMITVAVSPANPSVAVSGSQMFSATVVNTSNTVVAWQVNGVVGGNSTVGTISTAGMYTAPTSVPSPATVTITAISAADTARSGTAQVTVTPAASAAATSGGGGSSGGSSGGGALDGLTLLAVALGTLAAAWRRRRPAVVEE
jgi:hypothetical protein